MRAKRADDVLTHFRRRSGRYNKSSNWVVDPKLLGAIFEASGIKGGETVLDIATGTGLVAAQFRGKVKEVIGLDISADMTKQAGGGVDRLIISPVEKIPLPSSSIDVCVCRQGLQFTDLPRALAEIARVLKPGGRTVFCHLAAYGPEDQGEAFHIQALRNPARVNFFKPGDLEEAVEAAGLSVSGTVRYLSRESVDQWIDHGALNAEQRTEIKDAYRAASPAFKGLHKVEEKNGDILDTMLFLIIRAQKAS